MHPQFYLQNRQVPWYNINLSITKSKQRKVMSPPTARQIIPEHETKLFFRVEMETQQKSIFNK